MHKPKILNQNFVKQRALGSLSSFSGKYRFRNLDLQALVKEPALSDGRLQPGDKLLAANGVELASFSHQEVIILMMMMMMVMMIMVKILMIMLMSGQNGVCHVCLCPRFWG